MIFVFEDDSSVSVVRDLAEAQKNYETIDVESGEYAFYNGDGEELKPEIFTEPNTSNFIARLFKLTRKSYTLNVRIENTEPIWVKLAETDILNTNNWFATLEQLKQYLSDKGVRVNDPR